MSMDAIGIDQLAMLHRSNFVPTSIGSATDFTTLALDGRCLLRIHGIGQRDKASAQREERRNRLPGEDVLVSLHGYGQPIAFLVWGDPTGVAVHLGLWSSQSQPVHEDPSTMLQTALEGLYPSVKAQVVDAQIPGWLLEASVSGLVLGMPTTKSPHPMDAALPIDRLIRALAGGRWGFLVLAYPEPESAADQLRNWTLECMRRSTNSERQTGAPLPLVQHQNHLLQLALTNATRGRAVGLWRTGVYLLGDQLTFPRLSSVWRGIFSGEQSILEPIRIWPLVEAKTWANEWSLPDAPYKPPLHPYRYQTLLTSSQLAAYIHLPRNETSGFAVNAEHVFDAVASPIESDLKLDIGNVIHNGHKSEASYSIALPSLTRHVFIGGCTGAGKTNTIRNLLKSLHYLGIPYLVIEPAKTEYRNLLNDPNIGPQLQIFTLGAETVAPFRINPFEPVPGTPVGMHIDLLRAAFATSFGMWTPLPQIVERCLYEIYSDRGWDITKGTNHRLQQSRIEPMAFPTLTDMVRKVEEVIPSLGYDPELTSRLRAALCTRLDSLRIGGKGRMLDTQTSLPVDNLLSVPTILELDSLMDNTDKAFLMGLLFVRMVEYRRVAGETRDLRHLLVIEEAHRLLKKATPRLTDGDADAQGHAVGVFATLMAEVRAYGQGILISDQSPDDLDSSIIKNTNLKIAHRTVEARDRAILAASMVMTEPQATSLATLTVGQAAVFAEGDDAALLVQMPSAQLTQLPMDDAHVAAHMKSVPTLEPYRAIYRPHAHCAQPSQVCDAARAISETLAFRQTLSRILLSTIGDENAMDRLWPDLLAVVRPRRPSNVPLQALLPCLLAYGSDWFARRRGAQAAWPYVETREFAARVYTMLLAQLDATGQESARKGFQKYAYQLHVRTEAPYPFCERVCTEGTCLYRHAVADLVATHRLAERWQDADLLDRGSPSGRKATWDVCLDAAEFLVEYDEPGLTSTTRQTINATAYRIGLCFAQQMLSSADGKLHRTIRKIEEDLLMETKL